MRPLRAAWRFLVAAWEVCAVLAHEPRARARYRRRIAASGHRPMVYVQGLVIAHRGVLFEQRALCGALVLRGWSTGGIQTPIGVTCRSCKRMARRMEADWQQTRSEGRP